MESWKDAMKRLGVDLDAVRYKQREEDQGCVIRAFSSAVGVRAEESDYRERLIQLDPQDDTQFEYEYTSARRMGQRKSSALGHRLMSRDNGHIRRLPRLLAQRGTPLGKALGDYHIVEKSLSLPQIDDEVRNGNRVVGIFLLQTKRGGEKHAAHIIPDIKTHAVTLVSDEGAPALPLPMGALINTFVFKLRRSRR